MRKPQFRLTTVFPVERQKDIDLAAAKNGLTRSAWSRKVLEKELNKEVRKS
jgi:hypothetical protein